MGPLWRTLVPVGLLLVAIGFVAGAVVAAGSDEPSRRQPIEMVTAPSSDDSTPSRTPSSKPSRTTDVPVVTPRPGVDDGDDSDDRGGRPRGDDDDDDDERDDDD